MTTAPLKDRIATLETELKKLKAEEQAERHPYAFSDMFEAKAALRRHGMSGGEYLDRQSFIMKTLSNLADAESIEPDALHFLWRELHDVQEKLDAWHTRMHRLSIIVGEDDLNALAKYEGTKQDAPPTAA